MSFDTAKINSYFLLSTTIAKKFTKNMKKTLFLLSRTLFCKLDFAIWGILGVFMG